MKKETKYLYYKNTKIAYTITGKGNTIVLLHGFLENKNMWDYHIDFLAITHQVLAIDLLGHGESECLGYIHTMENQADMVYALLQELNITKASFVGHSMGGYIALAFTELYQESVLGLILLNSTSYKDSSERICNRDRAIMAVKKDYTTFVRIAIANLFSVENQTNLATEIEATKIEALKTPLQGIIAAQEGMKMRKDREIILNTALFPLLLILGEKDPVLNYTENIKQVEGTNTKLITFPDGHMSHIENKEELTVAFNHFFLQKELLDLKYH